MATPQYILFYKLNDPDCANAIPLGELIHEMNPSIIENYDYDTIENPHDYRLTSLPALIFVAENRKYYKKQCDMLLQNMYANLTIQAKKSNRYLPQSNGNNVITPVPFSQRPQPPQSIMSPPSQQASYVQQAMGANGNNMRYTNNNIMQGNVDNDPYANVKVTNINSPFKKKFNIASTTTNGQSISQEAAKQRVQSMISHYQSLDNSPFASKKNK